jgi:hypothetical protein
MPSAISSFATSPSNAEFAAPVMADQRRHEEKEPWDFQKRPNMGQAPEQVNDHDFLGRRMPRAPYGMYDPERNEDMSA